MTAELLSITPEALLRHLYDTLVELYAHKHIPAEWTFKWLCPIPKGLDEGSAIPDVENVRPLNLLDVIRKLWLIIIVRKIQSILCGASVLRGSQHAYMPGRGTDTALMQFTNAVEQAQLAESTLAVSS